MIKEYYGLRISPTLKDLPFRLKICKRFNMVGLIPYGEYFIALFKYKNDYEMTWGTMKMSSYFSKKLGRIRVEEEQIRRIPDEKESSIS